jgi:uncharacterized lipoprotein NlpE involved in copper resistance
MRMMMPMMMTIIIIIIIILILILIGCGGGSKQIEIEMLLVAKITVNSCHTSVVEHSTFASSKPVFLNHRAAARYRTLASIMPGRERPEKIAICYKISLVQLINN